MTEPNMIADALQASSTEAAEFLRLFSTPSRLLLLCHIAEKERSVGEIQEVLGLRQPALSQQLAELRQAGLVSTRRQSRQIHYSIADPRVHTVVAMLTGLYSGEPQPAPPATISTPLAAPKSDAQEPLMLGEMAQFARIEPRR